MQSNQKQATEWDQQTLKDCFQIDAQKSARPQEAAQKMEQSHQDLKMRKENGVPFGKNYLQFNSATKDDFVVKPVSGVISRQQSDKDFGKQNLNFLAD